MNLDLSLPRFSLETLSCTDSSRLFVSPSPLSREARRSLSERRTHREKSSATITSHHGKIVRALIRIAIRLYADHCVTSAGKRTDRICLVLFFFFLLFLPIALLASVLFLFCFLCFSLLRSPPPSVDFHSRIPSSESKCSQ